MRIFEQLNGKSTAINPAMIRRLEPYGDPRNTIIYFDKGDYIVVVGTMSQVMDLLAAA